MTSARALVPLALALAAACGSSTKAPAPAPDKPGSGSAVGSAVGSGSGSAAPAAQATLTATLSSATLEQDCAPPAADPAAKAEEPAKAAKAKRDSAYPPRCVQSELTLQVRLDGAAGTLRVARVALEADGAALGDLTPRSPTRWDAATSTFVPWDGALVPGAELQVRYALSAPPSRHQAYTLTATVEAVLADGAVIAAPPATLAGIAPEPMVKT